MQINILNAHKPHQNLRDVSELENKWGEPGRKGLEEAFVAGAPVGGVDGGDDEFV